MTVSIFIRTWRRDRFYADYLLRSLAKFAWGFHEIVVAIPTHDEPHFRNTDFHSAKVVWDDEPADDRGYMRQQISKCYADERCTGDFIVFLDSDCFLNRPLWATELFSKGGKPISLIRHWADAGSALPWKPIVEKFLKFIPCFETMCTHPAVIDRRVFPLFREYAKATHHKSLADYILEQPGNCFSEFNCLLNFAMQFTPYLQDWRIADPLTDGFPRAFTQRWTWGKTGVEEFATEYEKILAS